MTWEKKLAIAASIATIAAFFGLSIKEDKKPSPDTMVCTSVVTERGTSTSCSSAK